MATDNGRDSKLGERQTAQTSSKQGGCANNIVLHFGHMLTLYEQPVVIPPDATVPLYLPVKDA